MPFIHPSSIVEEDCSIGNGSKIWHFCHLSSHCSIGTNCNIGQNCFIASYVKLGNGVKVQNNVSLYEGLICEDEVFIGPSVVFTNIRNPRSFIQRKEEFLPTILKKGCSIGANCSIVCGVSIGEYALVGAGSVVTKDVKPYALVVGNPAKQIGWVDKAGNRLEFIEGFAKDSYDGTLYQERDEIIIEVKK